MNDQSLLFENLGTSQKAHLLLALAEGMNVLYVTAEGLEESKLFHDLAFFFSDQKVFNLPPSEGMPDEDRKSDLDTVSKRKNVLQTLSQTSSWVLLSSFQASLEKVPPPGQELIYVFHVREKRTRESVTQLLEDAGFEKVVTVEERGHYAVRGGIVDFFPLDGAFPVRLELYDDVIESIRSFEPLSQRSKTACESIQFASCRIQERELCSLFSLFSPESTILVFDDIEALEDRYATLLSSYRLSTSLSVSMDEWFEKIVPYRKLFFAQKNLEALSSVESKARKSFAEQEVSFSLFNRTWNALRTSPPSKLLREWYEEASLLPEPPVKEQFVDCFLEHQSRMPHAIVYSRDQDRAWFEMRMKERGGELLDLTKFQFGTLSESIIDTAHSHVFLTLHEVLHRATLPMYTQSSSSAYAGHTLDAFELEPGDTVVHYHHGIGRFFGIEKKPNIHGIEQEFFVLLYEDNSKLYVPFAQAHLLTKYIGGREEVPKLHQLGSTKWKKLRESTEQAIIGYASDLLKAYATRAYKGGFQFPKDSELMNRFEADFPYQETEDQQKAIDDVKTDMMSTKAMDRLVCGDVGYGKTEVAMRAACKAVLDGKKQVAVLVPTTVLALQHYDTFRERMEAYGIRVGHVSRFVPQKQNRLILEKVAYGEIDVLIGTHKILSKSVLFYDLGLIIVDEEQRFGVRAKEHLKLLKEGVDCLTLSATPIPRTLYLSLAGARDLSTIQTPPRDRLPIKTILTESSDALIRQALVRELNRGGQVFYIHNRVESIHEVSEHIRSLVPTARIVVGHGQMEVDALDVMFHAFHEGEADILVSTSIVENGIDIPNANTIIIDRADRFGMAELYQLRGRVGRWNRRAFAYFLLPKREVSELAKKRLDAIVRSSGYGGGFKVAMRDLELRGAGDILGTDQSGNVSSIGFHLYCKLLRRAVDALQGKIAVVTETKIEIPFDAKLDSRYVEDSSVRMQLYHRLGEAQSFGEVDAIQEEITDRYGRPPLAAEWLFALSKMKVVASQKGVSLLRLEKYTLIVEAKKGTRQETKRILLSSITTPEAFQKRVCEILAAL